MPTSDGIESRSKSTKLSRATFLGYSIVISHVVHVVARATGKHKDDPGITIPLNWSSMLMEASIVLAQCRVLHV
jgi:hypothetical protein